MFIPPVVVCGAIWWLSGQPTVLDPSVNDKLAHLLAFGVLGALWGRAWWFTTDWPTLKVGAVAFGLTAGYGVVDEIHQSFVPGRVASMADVGADVAGAALGVLLVLAAYVGTRALARRWKLPLRSSGLSRPGEP